MHMHIENIKRIDTSYSFTVKTSAMQLGQFFYKSIYGIFFFRLRARGGKKRKKCSENDQMTGHFQGFFSFSERF